MISGNEANTKKPLMQKLSKNSGFSLVEVLIASAIASVILVSTVAVVSNIYKSSKTIAFTQNFYAEARNLMGRISEIARENTIDYDRYFLTSGPDCGGLQSAQGQSSYPDVFFWDLDGDGLLDRNLFGRDPNGSEDLCTKAWHTDVAGDIIDTNGDILPLYLINGPRNKRFTLKFDNESIALTTEIGTDTDDDGKADRWGFFTDTGPGLRIDNNDICVYDDGTGNQTRILGPATKENCISTHAETIISLPEMKITNFSYSIGPNRDPFLSTRIDDAMRHPFTQFLITIELKNPENHGFNHQNKPSINLQNAVSSRVYGNTRK